MKRNYHHSRKYRQLKYALKQLKNSNKSDATFAKPLILKIKRLANQLKIVMATYRLKRLLAPALLALGISFQNPVAAQQFAEPVRNPFGMATLNPENNFIELVDIDNDGDLDLFGSSINYSREDLLSEFHFQENIGDSASPNFGEVKVNPFNTNHVVYGYDLSFVDIDGDGDFDIFASGYYNIVFFENTGTKIEPLFAEPVSNPFNLDVSNLNDNWIFTDFADLDGDGDLDMISTVGYFENIGDVSTPEFTMKSLEFPELPIEFGFPSFIDLNDDGLFDISIIGESDSNEKFELYFLKNEGTIQTPDFENSEVVKLIDKELDFLASHSFGDLDNDGDYDIIISQLSEKNLYFENTGTKNEAVFGEGSEEIFGLLDLDAEISTYVIANEMVDLDADGDYDIILGGVIGAGTYENNSILMYHENFGDKTNPNFGNSIRGPFEKLVCNIEDSEYCSFVFPSAVDIDGDNDFDLFITDIEGNIAFVENTGNAQNFVFEEIIDNPFNFPVNLEEDINKLIFADIDNDGDQDIFIASLDELVFLENTSNGDDISFIENDTKVNIEFPADAEDFFVIRLTDIDNDGDLDIFGNSYHNFYYYENVGNSNEPDFIPVKVNPFGLVNSLGNFDNLYLYIPMFADIDDDCDKDLFFGGAGNYTYYYENIDSLACLPTNINETGQLNISIYPNPTTEILHLTNVETINQIEIVNITGQTIKQFSKPKNTISLTGLPAAAYFIKITDVYGVQAVKKLFKQ